MRNSVSIRVSGENNQLLATVAGQTWRLARGAPLDELWEAMSEDDFADERIPYWTELWPASLVLARWLSLSQDEIKDRLCLDLGCGIGFTAILGAWLGADIVGVDYEIDALKCAAGNAKRNGVSGVNWLAMDWRTPGFARESIFRVWGGDIFYEKRSALTILDFLDYSLAGNGKAWLAEPGRKIFDHFRQTAGECGWSVNPVFGRGAGMDNFDESFGNAIIWEVSRRL